MKCVFLNEMHVDHTTFQTEQCTPENSVFKDRLIKAMGVTVKDLYVKPGFVYEHPNAFFFVNVGAAIPGDAECEVACDQLPPEEMAKRQKEYKATSLGINDPQDRELFKMGVIEGYVSLGGGKFGYIKGKMWDAYYGPEHSTDAKAKSEDLGI
jgi:hypothetical protein